MTSLGLRLAAQDWFHERVLSDMGCGRKIGPYDCCTCVCIDCLEAMKALPDGVVDAVISSPPYNTLPLSDKPSGLHADRKNGVNVWMAKAAAGYFDNRPEPEYQAWMIDVFTEAKRLTRGLLWINHKIRYRDGEAIHPARMFPWPIYTEVIWDRAGSMALNCKRYAPSTEHLIAFGKPRVWNDELNGLMSVWRIGFDHDDNAHPCAFPLELAHRPIVSSTNDADTILDPFCGSGTTLVAAKKLGRHFLGFEISAEYCAIARDRLARIDAQPTLFEPKPEQLTL